MRSCCSMTASMARPSSTRWRGSAPGCRRNVLPLRVNEVTQLGPEAIAAVFAFGGSGAAMLTRAKPKHDILACAGRPRCRTRSLQRSASAQAWCGSSRPTIPTNCAPCSMPRPLASRRKARRLRAARRQARRAGDHVPRIAPRGPHAGRCRAAGAGRAVRRRPSQCRGLHAVPRLRHRLSDATRCRTIPIAPCCASPKACACNAGFANRPAPKMSSRWSRGSTSRPGTRR